MSGHVDSGALLLYNRFEGIAGDSMDYFRFLYDKYQRESAIASLRRGGMSWEEFCSVNRPVLNGMERLQLRSGADEGVMYYAVHEENGRRVCDVPSCGYYFSSEKALSLLFTGLSDAVMKGGDTLFRIHLCAHDTAAQRLFSMMQFGFMAEKGLMRTTDAPPAREELFLIRTLTKQEIAAKWSEIWGCTREIIRHLAQAPVFYPGTEFTEQVYRAFYMDEGTSVHAAFSESDAIIGIIETNEDACSFLSPSVGSVNIGEIYVPPERRQTGLSQALLAYAARYEEKRGKDYLWLEHGTANPNARGFWNKYFGTYEYELVREVKSVREDEFPAYLP